MKEKEKEKEKDVLHRGTMIVLQHEISFKCDMPKAHAEVVDHTEGIEALERSIHDEVQEKVLDKEVGGSFDYVHTNAGGTVTVLVTVLVTWDVVHDPFQLGVEAVLVEFTKKADEVLDHKEVAKYMVIPIEDVQRYRDAIDTARDVLFS